MAQATEDPMRCHWLQFEKSARNLPVESVIVHAMNFLAHLWLADGDDGLRLGAMLGDFVRGNMDDSQLPPEVQKGIQLHRFIDQFMDGLPEMADLRQKFAAPFRRYAGIIIDVAFDHQLALRWSQYSDLTLEQFDADVRHLLARYEEWLPDELKGFMRYADRRGLFAAYREKDEILHSLHGLGRRLSRSNPLHRVDEIWDQHADDFARGFELIFPQVQAAVSDWIANHNTGGKTRSKVAGRRLAEALIDSE
ncbi:MAG TPA: ACP phosphodiesterase [Xanthomonadales bacterium]|nr:ACP phosphodiesterase [Xanthomonadales bacterium]